jgi:hypothetical protein
MDAMNKIFGAVTGVLEGGTVGTILKLVLLIGGGILFLILKNWIKKMQAEAAQKATEAGRAKDQADVLEENKKIEDDAKKAEQSVKDLLKKP